MEKKQITIDFEVLAYTEFSADDLTLINTAREATQRSYAPYSNFYVGAAILLDNGEIIPGSNQENAAFSSGTCAERSACFYAHARYPEARFRKIAIAARGNDGEFVVDPIPPCGSCRQALLEYETLAKAPVELLLVGRDKVYRLPSIAATLPFAFTEFN
jgi:cytidine deaminase